MKDFQSHLVYFKEIISYMQIVLKVNQIKNGKCIKVLCNQKQNLLTIGNKINHYSSIFVILRANDGEVLSYKILHDTD